MFLKRLQLTNFKNYDQLDVHFSSNVNCLVGNNGVGKTNMLDAIYYLSFCKSYFNSIDSMNIRHGADYFAIHGEYEGEEETRVSCTMKKGSSKQIKFNKKLCSSFAEHIGRIPLVMVSPYDQELVLGGSETRRKFMDGVMSQTDRNYLQILLQYQKALEQRNRLLKQFYEQRYFEEDSIAIWDEQLVRFGVPIHAARQQFLEEFVPLFSDYFALIANKEDERPNIRRVSQMIHSEGDEAPALDQLLVQARQRDAVMQYTTVGPHKDDLELCIGDYPVKKFGSQGQQKTFLLALKLAQFEYIRLHSGVKPILLLDDIFDKFDMLRVEQLVHLVGSSRFGQVFLTDTQPGRVESIFENAPEIGHKVFKVNAEGAIEQ